MEKQEPLIRVAGLTQSVCGEGALFGSPAARLELGATGQEPMTAAQIFAEMRAQSMPFDLVLTGDLATEPVDGMVKQAQDLGYKVGAITTGTTPLDWFANLDVLVVALPSPSTDPSNDVPADLPGLFETLQLAYNRERFTDVSLHIAVADDLDYEFARGIAELHPSVPLWLAATGSRDVNGTGWPDRLSWLSQRVIDDHWQDVQVVPHLEPPPN